MDYLSKKKEYIFLNNRQALVRVHVKQVSKHPYNIWVEGKSKNYRDCVALLNQVLKEFDPKVVPPIIIVSDTKLGNGAISSYNHVEDVIYFSNYYHTQDRINEIIRDSSFVSTSLKNILLHELGHKMHWDAIKRFYKANESKYNNINEAKLKMDEEVNKYIARQESLYLYSTLSMYASTSYKIAKQNNPINTANEVIAEEIAKDYISDPVLQELIKGELNYGKN